MLGHNTTSQLECAQSGNDIVVSFADRTIRITVDGTELAPLSDWTFALWLVLPIAMREGVNVEVAKGIDPVALSNARRLVATWVQWQPSKFRYVTVTALPANEGRPRGRPGRLFFFSGGVDSTNMLLRQANLSSDDAAMTICGLDYRPGSEQFDALITKSDSVLEHFGVPRIIVSTDASKAVRDLKINHAFVLSAMGFLFSDRFGSCHLAADARIDSEFLVFPWGTNSVSNALFRSANYRLVTEDLDEGRTDKIARLSRHPRLLEAVSFCSDRRYRPENCGVCGKCIRTKARFLVLNGEIPPIFLNNRFDEADIQNLDFNNKIVFQSMLTLFFESGPDESNETVRLIGRRLQKQIDKQRKKSALRKITRLFERR